MCQSQRGAQTDARVLVKNAVRARVSTNGFYHDVATT